MFLLLQQCCIKLLFNNSNIISNNVAVAFFVLLLAGCGHSPSPVTEIKMVDDSAASESIGGKLITIIQPEDTLYSIGFENNIDVRDLLAWNGISGARNVKVGQRIRLTKPLGYIEPVAPVISSGTKAVNVKKVPAAKVGKSIKVAKSINESKSAAEPSKSASPNKVNSGVALYQPTQSIQWSWPVKGKVIGWFSLNKAQKGLDISTSIGQKIKTTAPGKVVYQGSGIKGYGNLIIIKHSEDMLSAYAHNSKVLVREGEYIDKGKVISLAGARKGKSLLHFEIRKKGKPVNPMEYLR